MLTKLMFFLKDDRGPDCGLGVGGRHRRVDRHGSVPETPCSGRFRPRLTPLSPAGD